MMENTKFFLVKIISLIFISQCAFSLAEVTETNKNPKIIIIGAGPSGIAAASKLYENNFTDVTILEVENRIGGRVYTTQFGNYLVDLGGQWVHGVKNNIAYELANQYDLLDKPDKSDDDVEPILIDSSGNILSDEIMKKYSNFYDKYVDGAWFGSDKNYESTGQYIEKMFDEEFKNDTSMMNDKRKFLHILELSITGMDPAESWFNVSTASPYKECEGSQMVNWKERGYSTILDILMRRYPNPEKELPVLNNTILNSEVKYIDYSKDDGQISVSTTNGQSYKADHVIVTVSLGVLKEKHDTLFVPMLPENKVKAIQASGFGNVGKIFLLFDKPFWPIKDTGVIYLNFFWNEDDRKLIEEDPEKSWLLGVTGSNTVEHKPNLLELWISGKYARLMESLPEDKVFDHSVENLHRFLNKKYNVTKPIAMMRTQWFTNPHFRGTYSYTSVEAIKNNINADDLEEPITTQNLKILFAGEATSKDREGTVDGAIGSGWKAADRLLNHYKNVFTENK